MTELRQTDTNAADDSAGRVFGLDGNLYLPVLLTVLGSLATFALLGYLLQVPWTVAGLLTAGPVLAVLGWAVFLRQGKPAGYDRDYLDHLAGGAHFGKAPGNQEGLVE